MANYHIAGKWFVSVFELRLMSLDQLNSIANNPNYRKTTRVNAQNTINLKFYNQIY